MPLSLLALPIARRGSGSSSLSDFGAEDPIFCGSGLSTSASDEGGEPFLTVKNTFIDLAPLSGDEQSERNPRRARTCGARLLEPQGLPAFAAGDDSGHSGSDGTSSDTCFYESTPWVNSPVARVAARLPVPAFAADDDSDQSGSDGTRSDTCFYESTPWGASPVARVEARLPGPLAESAREGTEVVLQVPLRVHFGHPLASGASSGFEFDVAHEGGQTIIRLRVGAEQSGDVALASPPTVAPARSMGASNQASSPRTSKDSGAVAPPPPPRRASATGTTPPQVVCRHWKNKGWCKFKDTCKFLHPDHKKGVGPTAAAHATAAIAQQQQATPSPAAQPSAGKAGRRF